MNRQQTRSLQHTSWPPARLRLGLQEHSLPVGSRWGTAAGLSEWPLKCTHSGRRFGIVCAQPHAMPRAQCLFTRALPPSSPPRLRGRSWNRALSQLRKQEAVTQDLPQAQAPPMPASVAMYSTMKNSQQLLFPRLWKNCSWVLKSMFEDVK